MEIALEQFFEDLKKEKVNPLFKNTFPWEPLKYLKEYLLDNIAEINKNIPTEVPLPESIFLTSEGEVIPLKEIEIFEGNYYFKTQKIEGTILKAGSVLIGKKFFFEKEVIVEPFAVIFAPAYFSRGTQIRHGAYIRGSVYTGEKVVIGHATEVKNSIILSFAKAAHFAYIGDSILGKEVNLGAGTKLANLKFSKKEIFLIINKTRFNTGLKKLGAILGDKSQTGCNVVLQPGTLFGKRSIIYPGKVAGPGYFPPETKIK